MHGLMNRLANAIDEWMDGLEFWVFSDSRCSMEYGSCEGREGNEYLYTAGLNEMDGIVVCLLGAWIGAKGV